MLKHQNLVRMQYGAEPVRYHDAGSPGHQLGNGALNLPLGLSVHRAGRLVQNENGRVQRQGAREAQELALTHTEAATTFTEAVAVPLRQPLDKPVRSHPPGSLPCGLGRDAGVEGEIVLNVAGEQE